MMAATAKTEWLAQPAEMEAAGVVSTPMAIFGLIFLTLAPFAWLTNNVRMILSGIGVLVYVAVKPKILSAHNFITSWPADKSHLREIYMWLTLLFLHAIFCSVVSAAILLPSGEVTKSEFFERCGAQLLSLLLAFFQIACGFHMAKYMSTATIRASVYLGFWISIAVSIYQTIAIAYGLPFIGLEVVDSRVGLRPSGLAGEPKTLAAYLVVVLLLLLIDEQRQKRRKLLSVLMRISGIILAAKYFVGTSSGNGWVSAAILVIVYLFFLSSLRTSLAGITLGLLLAIVFVSSDQHSLSELQLRENHEAILGNLSNLDLGLFDDLVALPMMAWLDNPLNVLLGFGPGLMHFFANRYLYQAAWLTGESYIDGNVSAIAYISNFGLLIATFLFVHIFRKGRKVVKSSTDAGQRPIRVFFLASFVVGATVAANVGCPFYISIGYILAISGAKPNDG